MALIIPARSDTATYIFTIELEGAIYQFRMQFNDRDQSWFFDILDVDGNVIRQGVKVVANWPLLRLVASELRPPGELYAVDLTGEARRAGVEDLGSEILFVYLPEAEVPDPLFPVLT